MTLYPKKAIYTDFKIARKVEEGIRRKFSDDAYSLIELGYYTCHPYKERLIADFVRLAIEHGKKVVKMLTNDTVNELQTAVKALTREAHQLMGFVRFTVYNSAMAAIIEPKNFVLPLLREHFCDRYRNETFIIYDKTHGAALIYRFGRSQIIAVDEFLQPEAGENEVMYRSLWKLFYNTIAIQERENPKCRLQHMQKRYWKHLTEMSELAPACEKAGSLGIKLIK